MSRWHGSSVSPSLGEFILGNTLLGEGTFSQVKLGQELTTGQTVAIKIIDHRKLSEYDKKCVEVEIGVLKKLHHPYLVKYLDDFRSEEHTFIVLEYVPGGNLFQLLKNKGGRIGEDEARALMRQMLQGLAKCHSLSIAHRDLKLEHVLLDAHGRVRIIDFGLATECCGLLETYCGSPLYIAPEITRRVPHSGEKLDVWALGIILYVMLCGRFPFFADTKTELFASIMAGKFAFPRQIEASLSGDAQHIVRSMLNPDPALRPTCNQLLQSPWLATASTSNNPTDASTPKKPEPTSTSRDSEESDSSSFDFNCDDFDPFASDEF